MTGREGGVWQKKGEVYGQGRGKGVARRGRGVWGGGEGGCDRQNVTGEGGVVGESVDCDISRLIMYT